MAKVHYLNSPSGAHRWLPCPGSTALAKGIPDRSSGSADEGTCAHEFAALALIEGKDAKDYIGRDSADAPGQVFTKDMAPFVQQYVDYIRAFADAPGCLSCSVEEEVDMTDRIVESAGTSDAIIISEVAGLVSAADPTQPHIELRVTDLKFGRGVKVYAEANEQMLLYALGALEKARLLGMRDPDSIVVVVHQPRLGHVDEWATDVATLERFTRGAAAAGEIAKKCWDGELNPLDYLSAGEDQCKFCRAQAICPEKARAVQETTMLQFDDLDAKPQVANPLSTAPTLAQQMDRVGEIERWCKAVRAATEAALLAGEPVGDWKLVQGRLGPRQWKDATEAEAMLRKTFRLKVEDAYELTLISPTKAEALKDSGLIGDRQWLKLQPLIGRSEGSLSVAPGSDKRPAVNPTVSATAFDDLGPEPESTPTPEAVSSPASHTTEAELDGAELI